MFFKDQLNIKGIYQGLTLQWVQQHGCQWCQCLWFLWGAASGVMELLCSRAGTRVAQGDSGGDTGTLFSSTSLERAGKVQEVPILRMHPHPGSKAPCHVPKPFSTLPWKPEITVAGLGICHLTVFSAVNISLLKFKASQKRINCDKLPTSQKSWKKAQKVKMSHFWHI